MTQRPRVPEGLKSPLVPLVLLFASVCVSVLLVVTALTRTNHAVAYICSTTTVLDALVVTAADQIQANLDNGTYGKLKRQGVLSQANIDAARATLVKYRDAHRQLQANGACEGI